ncbi:MAG: hypothetical protein WD066_15920 [Planctomycetaceae bacterium]
MTQLLQQALAQLEELPAAEQDAIAALILEELDDERRWDESFARTQEQLGRIAEQVRQEIRAGRVRAFGPDEP